MSSTEQFGSTVLAVVLVVGACGSPTPSRSTGPTSTPTPAPTATPTASPSPTFSPIPAPSSASGLSGQVAISNDRGIAVLDLTTNELRQVTSDAGFDPTWSPDGTKIAYRRLEAHDDGEIWLADLVAGTTRDLVNDPDWSDWGPAWSPDGTRIAYSSNREIAGLAIWLMDADGSNARPIGRGHGEYPAWSMDGQQIAYAGGSYYDIRVMNADGTGDHAVTTSPAYEMYPAWSPDGQWIAYETQADFYPRLTEPGMGPEMEIHVMRPDGTDDRRLTNDRLEDYFPTWSPDGKWLMWVSMGTLVVAHPDGTGRRDVRLGNFPAWR